MKTQYIAIIAVLIFAGFFFFVARLPHSEMPPEAPVARETGLLDRNDRMIKEGDILKNDDQHLVNTVKYGMYEGKEQFYTINSEGVTFVLEDLGDEPKEKRSEIVIQ